MNKQIEAVAKAINIEGWTCLEGSDEPGSYDECEECKRVCDVAAKYVLAAAHPQVSSRAELDALPVDSVVISETIAYQKYKGDDWAADGRFYETGQIELPATVLHWGNK